MTQHKIKTTSKLLSIIIMILVGAIVQVYLPWYTMGMAFGIISYLLLLPSRSAFVVGGGAGFILWALAAIWMDKQFPSTLPGRMAQLLPLGGSVMALYLLTGVFGGLTGALWSWAGSKLRGSH